MNLELVCEFLGWCTVINCGLFLIGMIKVVWIQEWASNIHARLFGLEPETVRQSYFHYLVVYKIAIIFLNLVPYIALKAMMTT